MDGLTQEQTIENLNAQVASLDAMNMERLKELHQARTTLIVKDAHLNKLIKQIQDLNKEIEELKKPQFKEFNASDSIAVNE